MTIELKAAVLVYLAGTSPIPPPSRSWELPTFHRPDERTVEWVSGRPELVAFSVELLEALDEDDPLFSWDAAAGVLRMPGDLAYQPMGLSRGGEYNSAGGSVVCRRVGA